MRVYAHTHSHTYIHTHTHTFTSNPAPHTHHLQDTVTIGIANSSMQDHKFLSHSCLSFPVIRAANTSQIDQQQSVDTPDAIFGVILAVSVAAKT